MYKSVALIPARSGSKRVKNKNILRINNHPLLAYAITNALKSKIFDRVICVTDSPRYSKIAKKYGAEVPRLRPEKYSGDKSSDIEWLMWIMKEIDGINKYDTITRGYSHIETGSQDSRMVYQQFPMVPGSFREKTCLFTFVDHLRTTC